MSFGKRGVHTENSHVQRHAPMQDYTRQAQQTYQRHKPWLLHLHNYWHIYISVFIFALFHCVALFPKWFPGTANINSIYDTNLVLGFVLYSLPAAGVYVGLRGLRRSLQRAARLSESSSWTIEQWIGAAIGLCAVFYWIFIHQGPLEEAMLPEFQKSSFNLTPREWIMAGVKCAGGAVAGAIFARKFTT